MAPAAASPDYFTSLRTLLFHVLPPRRGAPLMGDHKNVIAALHDFRTLITLLQVFNCEWMKAEFAG